MLSEANEFGIGEWRGRGRLGDGLVNEGCLGDKGCEKCVLCEGRMDDMDDMDTDGERGMQNAKRKTDN